MPLTPTPRVPGRLPRRPWRPICESLEGRALMADFTLYGTKWADPSRITYSIASDGASWVGTPNVISSFLNGVTNTSIWQRDLARALQTWASISNINVVRVGDGLYTEDTGGYAQGDSRFGDIRFGAINLLTSTTLAQTYFPPPNGVTAAGDVTINTEMHWSIGDVPGKYDLYSVVLHETGHSLGLDHSHNPGPVMYADYGGYRLGLTADDIAGIQTLYGARTPDAYHAIGQGSNFGSSIDLTGGLDASSSGTLRGLSLSTIGDTEYFTVVAPANADGASIQVQAVASGVSSLSPKITLYDPQGNELSSNANPNDWGDTVTAQASGVTAGKRYLVAVTGATSDVFAVGGYSLKFSFPGSTPPPQLPPTQPPPQETPPAVPHVGNNSFANATNLGTTSTKVTVGPLSLPYGTDVAFFAVTTGKAGTYQATAYGLAVQIFDSQGRLVTQGRNGAAVKVSRAGVRLYVAVDSMNGAPVTNYTLNITTQTQTKLSRSVTPKKARQLANPENHWSRTALKRAGHK